jgi:acyl phosphate:glycerol-3-phosphate acyltransferase
MPAWFFLLLSYLWGAIPASYLAGRWTRGIDLRHHGSGNLGATNTFRVLGPRIAAPVMAFDILKGLLPVVIFTQWDNSLRWQWELAYGFAAIVGHIFSLYMGFKGGKGVATAAGVFLGLAQLPLAAGLVVWLLVLQATRMVSAASISAALVVGAVLLVVPGDILLLPHGRTAVRAMGCVVALLIVVKHRSNIGRILSGTEPRFGRKSVTADGAGKA